MSVPVQRPGAPGSVISQGPVVVRLVIIVLRLVIVSAVSVSGGRAMAVSVLVIVVPVSPWLKIVVVMSPVLTP